MVEIKIISNPYRKEIKYQKRVQQGWEEINGFNEPDSPLLNEDRTHGFFPFHVRKIVDEIINAYENGDEKIQIVFEGSSDEYEELKTVCAEKDLRSKVEVAQLNRCLENARDILPEVKRLFAEMSPLISCSIAEDKIERDAKKFKEASNDVVPIVVLGNYSAGKSTFINALIGSEILPSGNDPVTAKVFKIKRSESSNYASVCFAYDGETIEVCFDTDGSSHNLNRSSVLGERIEQILEENKNQPISLRVHEIVNMLNDFEMNTEETVLSDLIEVEIPFRNGVLANTEHSFVLFDTPGSNSATNRKHLEVLKDAMANMTNGLPIFLCKPDALDTTDNEALYKIIRDLKELDERFTMIVVNKADDASLSRIGTSEKEEKSVLNQAVPRQLYEGGLFYVSSILGLGSKNDGVFLDDQYAETYEDQSHKYSNPSDRRYKQLYKFDILPKQIKKRVEEQAEQESNLVYANSGLFSVEKAIETFAGKYAAYNKCFKSLEYLNNVIDRTQNEIEDKKLVRESERKNIGDQLDKDKKILNDRLHQRATSEMDAGIDGYALYMKEQCASFDSSITRKELAALKKKLRQLHSEKNNLAGVKEDLGDSLKNAKNRAGSLFRDYKEVAKNLNALKEDAQASFELLNSRLKIEKQVNADISKDLLRIVTDQLNDNIALEYKDRDEKSRSYWNEKSDEIRTALIEIIQGSDTLTEDRRKELEKIVADYQTIEFDRNLSLVKEKLDFRFGLGEWQLFVSDDVNDFKVVNEYGRLFENAVLEGNEKTRVSHEQSMLVWVKALLDEIQEHIISYSPELSKQAQKIEKLKMEITELENRAVQLTEYTDCLEALMEWKEA